MNCEIEAPRTGGDVPESTSRLPGTRRVLCVRGLQGHKQTGRLCRTVCWPLVERRETAVRNEHKPMWRSFPVGTPAAGNLFLSKQNFGHTKLLSGRIAARIVFRSGWHWLHSLTHARLSRFEQQHSLPREEKTRQWRDRSLPSVNLPSTRGHAPRHACATVAASSSKCCPCTQTRRKAGKPQKQNWLWTPDARLTSPVTLGRWACSSDRRAETFRPHLQPLSVPLYRHHWWLHLCRQGREGSGRTCEDAPQNSRGHLALPLGVLVSIIRKVKRVGHKRITRGPGSLKCSLNLWGRCWGTPPLLSSKVLGVGKGHTWRLLK